MKFYTRLTFQYRGVVTLYEGQLTRLFLRLEKELNAKPRGLLDVVDRNLT